MAVLVYRLTESGFARFTEDGLDLRVIDVSPTAIPPFIPTLPSAGDISTIWQPMLGFADWEMQGPLLKSGMNLDTALYLSLFSDHLAAADDMIPDGSDDRRGWWGDTFDTVPIGSRLWLLDRAKLTKNTPLQCSGYITEALQWMLDDGVAEKINVQTALRLPSAMAAQIQIYQQDGPAIARNFAWVWKEVN